MFHRIKMLALATATLAMLFVGSTAMAAPWRGGFGVGVGRGWGGYGYRGGYVGGYGLGGYGRYYGGYRGYPGYYGGYGYGYPGYGYRSYGYYPSYGYYGSSYYSSPTVYSSPSVVYSAPSTVYAAPETRITTAKPIVPNSLAPAGNIKLRLPAGSDGSVNYQLNGTAFVLNPGFAQKFDNDRSWTITFDDGTGQTQSHGLTSGNWEFVRNTDGRWELRGF